MSQLPNTTTLLNKVEPDYFLLTDALSVHELEVVTGSKILNPERVIVMIDHDTPSGTVAVAEKQKVLRDFARNQKLCFHYGSGIGYYIAMEKYVKSGDIVACCGRHAATLGAVGAVGISLKSEDMKNALETGSVDLSDHKIVSIHFEGNLTPFSKAKDIALTLAEEPQYKGKILAIHAPQLPFCDRVTICNLLANVGVTSTFFTDTTKEGDRVYLLETIEPKAVLPGSFDNIVPSAQIDGLRVNQVFIGGCCGGNIETLRKAAGILKHRQVSKYVRTMVAPATDKVYIQAIDEGLIDIFMAAHVLVMNQGCSACWAQSQGRCDHSEVFVTTGSVNCANWAGAFHNGIYITSVESAVQAALTGNLYEN